MNIKMKKLNILLSLMGAVVLLSFCNKEPEYYTLDDQPDEMHVKSNVEKIILSASHLKEDAVVLTWSAIPTQYPVTYSVRFLAADNPKENCSDFYEVGTATTFAINHNDLNSLIARWSIPGEELKVTAQVVGTINNELKYIKPELSSVNFIAVGWEKYPQQLVAHITDLNDNKRIVELSQRQQGTGVYEASVDFTPSTFYFTKNAYSEWPAYYQGADGKLQYVEEEGEYEPFKCIQTGKFTLIVDVNDEYLDVRILDIKLPASSKPYMVGDGTDIHWNTGVVAGYMTFTDNPRTPYIYSYTGQFYARGEYPDEPTSEGTFKILLNDSYSEMCFYAPEADCNPLENHTLTEARKGGSDLKWLVPATGKYTFTIDLLNMTTSFEPVN